MISGQHISYSIGEFLTLTRNEFSGILKERSQQTVTWDEEFDHLQNVLSTVNKEGRVIFEYGIPSQNFVIDVVLLIEEKIFVLEYKCGESSTAYDVADIRQVRNYALRLKYFHSQSNDKWIIPILIEMEASIKEIPIHKASDIQLWDTVLCNRDTLKDAITKICIDNPGQSNKEWENNWEKGVYKATPTIIKAACDMWERNNVKGLDEGEADKDTRLSAEDCVMDIVKKAKEQKKKALVFITGVPGAGKTLVGLGLSIRCQQYGASMLSGNDPLVKVLSTALRKDLDKQYKAGNLKDEVSQKYLEATKKETQKEKDLEKNKISVDAVIRAAYSYKQEIINFRLNWEDGSYELNKDADRGSQHVIIFDEAQRAWTKKKMLTPGQSGKKDWQKKSDWPFSEPALLLWDMNQRDWGVFVCLVGGGQEINTGEAGIGEWLMSINSIPQFNSWEVYMADNLLDPIYQRKTEENKSLSDYISDLEKTNRLNKDSRLHLTASQRSIRNTKVSDFIEKLLSCETKAAKSLYEEIFPTYQIYITRDIDKAKSHLRNCYQTHKDLDDDIRIGILMSSKAARLRPIGYEVKKVSEYLNKVSNWFLDPGDYISSSNFLEIALNEFFVQGLELDFTAVMWDADLRYNANTNNWDYFDFDGKSKWSNVYQDTETQDIKRFYMKNAYRVLLTRARAGMVIYIPTGDKSDKTREPYIYDNTYNYLQNIGIKTL